MSIPDPTHVVMRFYRALDDGEFDVLASLIAEDGAWHRGEARLRTEDEIAAALSKVSQTRALHHLFCNLYAEIDGDEAEVTGYMLAVMHDTGARIEGPALLTGIDSIRTSHARLRREGAGWRIVKLWGGPVSFAAAA